MFKSKKLIIKIFEITKPLLFCLSFIIFISCFLKNSENDKSTNPPDDQLEEQEETLDEKMDRLSNEIEFMLEESQECTVATECNVKGYGDKPCGGPSTYVIYSSGTEFANVLVDKIDEYNELDELNNMISGIMSDCMIIQPPITDCVDNICEEVMGESWNSLLPEDLPGINELLRIEHISTGTRSIIGFRDPSYDVSIISIADPTNWEYLASPGEIEAWGFEISLFNNSNGLYVAYENQNFSDTSNQLVIDTFINNQWDQVVRTDFLIDDIYDLSLSVNEINVPYICYTTYATDEDNFITVQALSVLKFEDNTWQYAGGKDFYTGEVGEYVFKINNGIPYLFLIDRTLNKKAVFLKFNGSSWVEIG